MNDHGSTEKPTAFPARLAISRQDLAAHLAAYGEPEASAWVQSMPDEKLARVQEIAAQHAFKGIGLFQAGCLAVVEVVEGAPRALRRSRRNWRDVPRSMCAPSALRQRILERFEKYGDGTPLRKREILNTLSAALGPRMPNFRYKKTTGEFYSTFENGYSFIGINARYGHLSFTFGVMHNLVEETKHRLFGQKHTGATIFVLSVNMGPNSFHWPHPTETTWPITGSLGLDRAIPEVCDFVERTVLPYVLGHQDPLAIRKTLLHAPGHSQSFGPERSVFAIDYLMGRRDWVDEDFETLVTVREATKARLREHRARQKDDPFTAMFLPAMHSTNVTPDPIRAAYEATIAAWDR